ncbi:hypothetical protein PG991_015826 [Apiospora marii]|uniref:BZIP domain-containing protein n=1 Tax=Apiospora marii TaxID=335849 RepID=A0ABR1QZS4_9PEZI
MPASNAIGGPERQTLGDAAGSVAQTGIATRHLPFLVTINPAPEFKPNTTNKQGDNSTTMDFSAFAQLDLPPIPENPTMDFSAFAQLDLPPIPENPTMDFDLFGSFNNQDMFNPSTFDSLHPDSTTETATASLDRTPEDKLKLLQKENQQLCRQLDSIQSQYEAKDRHVRHLEAEIARYREQCKKQNKAVEHIADTIALAFRDYQDITGTQSSSEVAQQPNTVDEISITYADVISAWSDSSLE